VGTVVRFGKRSIESARPLPCDSQFDLQATLTINADRIEAATSACEVIVGCIEKLHKSLEDIDSLQRTFLGPGDRRRLELQSTAARSQLSWQLGKLADILRTLGDAAEQASGIEVSLKNAGTGSDPAAK